MTPYDLKDICRSIARGESLRSIAADYVVDESTLREWLRADPDRAAAYDAARVDRAHRYADEIVELADSTGDGINDKQRRLQIDTRKWLASKFYPKMYGERIMQEHSGTINLVSALKELDGGAE